MLSLSTMDSASIFNVFPQFEPALMEELEATTTAKVFKAGDEIIRTGQAVNNAVLVLSGRLKIYREDNDGSEYFMYYLEPGQACAVSLSCAARRVDSEVSAIAMDASTLLFLPLAEMNEWMKTYRSWYEFVIATYRERFEELLEVLDNVAFRSMDERLEFYLKKQYQSCGCTDISINHQSIANDLNSSREVISRLLKKMEQRLLLKLHRNHIELLGHWFR